MTLKKASCLEVNSLTPDRSADIRGLGTKIVVTPVPIKEAKLKNKEKRLSF